VQTVNIVQRYSTPEILLHGDTIVSTDMVQLTICPVQSKYETSGMRSLVLCTMHGARSPEVDICSIEFLLRTWWFTDTVISIIRSSKSINKCGCLAADNVSGFLSAVSTMNDAQLLTVQV